MANRMPSGHATLVSLLKEHSLRLGEFTLSSGKTSHYYVDARPTTMSARGLEVIGSIGVDIVAARGVTARSVGGLTLGAEPVAYAIAMASQDTDQSEEQIPWGGSGEASAREGCP